MSQFARYLRIFGGLALASSALVFLVQGYSSWSSFERFLAFFGLVVVNGAAGLLCVYKLNEPKSARTFLGFMAAGVSVLFAQMGAMIYSSFNAPVSHLPAILKFEALNATSIALALALTGAILLPATLTAFRALMRPRSRELFEGFIVLNLLLLIPVRQVEMVCLFFVAAVAFFVYVVNKSREEKLYFKTLEGLSAHLILAAPIAILFGRGLFYDFAYNLAATAMMVVGFILPFIGRAMPLRQNQVLLDSASFFLLALSWLSWSEKIDKALRLSAWEHAYVYILPLVAVAMTFAAVKLYSKSIVNFAFGALTLVNATLALTEPGIQNYLLILGLGAAMSFWAFTHKDRNAFILGSVNIGYSIVGQSILGLRLIESWTWLTLAICGVVGILLASMVEKNSLNLKDRYQRLMANFE